MAARCVLLLAEGVLSERDSRYSAVGRQRTPTDIKVTLSTRRPDRVTQRERLGNSWRLEVETRGKIERGEEREPGKSPRLGLPATHCPFAFRPSARVACSTFVGA